MFKLMPTCLRLFLQTTFLPCSLAFCSAGISIAINSAMTAITTSNSINVNPRRSCMAFNHLSCKNLHADNVQILYAFRTISQRRFARDCAYLQQSNCDKFTHRMMLEATTLTLLLMKIKQMGMRAGIQKQSLYPILTSPLFPRIRGLLIHQ